VLQRLVSLNEILTKKSNIQTKTSEERLELRQFGSKYDFICGQELIIKRLFEFPTNLKTNLRGKSYKPITFSIKFASNLVNHDPLDNVRATFKPECLVLGGICFLLLIFYGEFYSEICLIFYGEFFSKSSKFIIFTNKNNEFFLINYFFTSFSSLTTDFYLKTHLT